MRHTHLTRDIKPEGECPGCDSDVHLPAARREIARLRAQLNTEHACQHGTTCCNRELWPGEAQ